jgi:hypothetical protein
MVVLKFLKLFVVIGILKVAKAAVYTVIILDISGNSCGKKYFLAASLAEPALLKDHFNFLREDRISDKNNIS